MGCGGSCTATPIVTITDLSGLPTKNGQAKSGHPYRQVQSQTTISEGTQKSVNDSPPCKHKHLDSPTPPVLLTGPMSSVITTTDVAVISGKSSSVGSSSGHGEDSLHAVSKKRPVHASPLPTLPVSPRSVCKPPPSPRTHTTVVASAMPPMLLEKKAGSGSSVSNSGREQQPNGHSPERSQSKKEPLSIKKKAHFEEPPARPDSALSQHDPATAVLQGQVTTYMRSLSRSESGRSVSPYNFQELWAMQIPVPQYTRVARVPAAKQQPQPPVKLSSHHQHGTTSSNIPASVTDPSLAAAKRRPSGQSDNGPRSSSAAGHHRR